MFADRVDAGRQLARHLMHLRREPVVVLGLPRGGVPVAAQVADALGAPLDVIIVRKVGVPHQPELAMGAVGEDGVRVVSSAVMAAAGVSEAAFEEAARRETAEVAARAERYRQHGGRLPLQGRTALIVDDGIATGATARAACQVARAEGAARIVLAVPVGPSGWQRDFLDEADELICILSPDRFHAVGEWYSDFSQTSDDEVLRHLSESARRAAPPPDGHPDDLDEEVFVEAGPVRLAGHLAIPDGARGIVIFAHGSGSSRRSPRNQFIARFLNASGLGTLLFDLLSAEEEARRANVFDISLLASRLLAATAWLRAFPQARDVRIGYFGASTGAAAALWAATEPNADVSAIVSRGGRPDLAGPRLSAVHAPTLLIVGGDDHQVLDLNRSAARELRCRTLLAVVPGATHLFEEPGTLEQVAKLARDWFREHLLEASGSSRGSQVIAPSGGGGR